MILKQEFSVKVPVATYTTSPFYLSLTPLRDTPYQETSYIAFKEADFKRHHLPLPTPILDEEGKVERYLWLKRITLTFTRRLEKLDQPDLDDVLMFELQKDYTIKRSSSLKVIRRVNQNVKLATNGYPYYPSQLPIPLYDINFPLSNRDFARCSYYFDSNPIFTITMAGQ